jgi:outer membrane protein assembly factor BamB
VNIAHRLPSPSNAAMRTFAPVALIGVLITTPSIITAQYSWQPRSFRGDATHRGVYNGGGANLVGLQWRFLTDGDVVSSPTIADSTVFVGSSDGRLYALDLRTGRERWHFDAGAAVTSSPAVTETAVYFGTYDEHFLAVDRRTGSLLWRRAAGPVMALPWGHESGDRYTSSPAIAGQTVVFGAGDGQVYAVDASSGRVRWKAATGGRVRSSPAISDGMVVVGSFDGCIYAFDLATGTRRWRYATEGAGLFSGDFGFDRRSIQSSPAIAQGVAFVGARDGFVYAVNVADGKLRWRFDHKISWIIGSPAVADGVVYAGSSDAHFVQALDAAAGREIWRTMVGVPVWSSPSVAGDQLIVGDGAGRIHLFDRRDGKEIAAFHTGSQVFSSPVVAGQLAVVGSADGGVYALRLGEAPVRRAVFLDSTYATLRTTGHAAELAAYLRERGYTQLGPAELPSFLQERIAGREPSVIVFATDQLPASVVAAPLNTSLVRRYLDASGKVVWVGMPPLLATVDSAGHFPSFEDFQWDVPTALLGVDHRAAIFDQRGIQATMDGLRWGLPRLGRTAWSVSASGVSQTLATDEWGLAAAWVKNYGGPPGTGFVRVPNDDLLSIYLAAEYRPLD